MYLFFLLRRSNGCATWTMSSLGGKFCGPHNTLCCFSSVSGDDVILLEPFFDLYVNQVKLAGGTPVYVPLTFVPYENDGDDGTVTGGEWILEPEKLNAAISSKTRSIVLNSPHNPTGKVFTRKEMGYIADAVENAGPQCVVLSDEVYKYIVHSPPLEEVDDADLLSGEGTRPESISSTGHVHFASLPGMWDRTITISSAGKTFSATGWQVGWCVGPAALIAPVHQLLPYVQFCASTVIQEALARALPRADEPYEGHPSYYEYLKAKYTRKRDLLATALRQAGFAVPDWDASPGGGFFIFARIGKDIADAVPSERIMASNPAAPGGVARRDWALCQWMAEEKGVLCIPASPFFSRERAEEGASDEFVRIAFCKTDETIEKAAQALMNLRGGSTSASSSTAGEAATETIEEEVVQ
uniref:Aminotransferase class I/classII large domain-containing protein n=1 Tax=Odontella aurita TaxID=265563 RepID=A0A7S4I3R0_9STRA|mmetsp:Transcript_19384/g.56700  ORF Transcript_19384/g.56700 Transcript_19384/m.56700 type:complete len:413 (+) Transcript_19384:44-1282(+)